MNRPQTEPGRRCAGGPLVIVFLLIVVIIAVVVGLKVSHNNRQRTEYDELSVADPLDPFLSEVLLRHQKSWREIRDAENAVRAHAQTLSRLPLDRGSRATLIVHSDDSIAGGLLVITSAQSVVFARGGSTEVAHRGASTKIMAGPNGVRPTVHVDGLEGHFRFQCADMTEAQLICSAIDIWLDNPAGVSFDPRVVVTASRIEVPDAFFVDTLRAAGHAVTPTNLRSLHERFGMLFIGKARAFIDNKYGARAGEQFTARFGRPDDDRLPEWPVTVLRGWLELEPTAYPMLAAILHIIRDFLLTAGYLDEPSRPLQMWQADNYTHDGAGRLKRPTGGPSINA